MTIYGTPENNEFIFNGQGDRRYYGAAGDDSLTVDAATDAGDAPSANQYLLFNGGDGTDSLNIDTLPFEIYDGTINTVVRNVEFLNIRTTWNDNSDPFFSTLNLLTTQNNRAGAFDVYVEVTDLNFNIKTGATDDYFLVGSVLDHTNEFAGQFWINSGAGNDWIVVGYTAQSTTPFSIFTSAGNDMITADGDNIAAYGGPGQDTMDMSGSNLTLRGGGGDDQIAVREGSDNWVSGGLGNDVIDVQFGYGNNKLYGGAGDDVIIGGEEGDLIYGGAGADVLRGGYGADRFVFRKVDAGATDEIFDFEGVELDGGDLIDLTALAPGRLVWRGDLAFTGTSNEVRMIDGQVQVDFNADGTADLLINIGYNLTVGDFIL